MAANQGTHMGCEVPTLEVQENSNSWLEFIGPPSHKVQIQGAVSATEIYFLHRQDCHIEHSRKSEFQINNEQIFSYVS